MPLTQEKKGWVIWLMTGSFVVLAKRWLTRGRNIPLDENKSAAL
jgi:hypothetical protein